MSDLFATEILEFHRFLDAWLKGQVDSGDGEPTRLARALGNEFEVIHPDGGSGDKAAVIDSFTAAYGEKPPEYALEIDSIKTRRLSPDLCLATYVERHRGEPGRARVASAVLRRHTDGHIEWLFLQETPAPHLDRA